MLTTVPSLGALRCVFENDNQLQVCGETANGRDAVDKACELKPDLIVLDFAMPVMNGLEAARLPSVSMPTIPLILYTMHAGKVLEAQAKAAGFKALVSKNQDIGLLITQTKHLLGLLG